MLKRMIARLLLFGIPFGVSYWASMPAAPVAANQPLVVCAYPGERPGNCGSAWIRRAAQPHGGSKVAGRGRFDSPCGECPQDDGGSRGYEISEHAFLEGSAMRSQKILFACPDSDFPDNCNDTFRAHPDNVDAKTDSLAHGGRLCELHVLSR
jgi:hypothetical protein